VTKKRSPIANHNRQEKNYKKKKNKGEKRIYFGLNITKVMPFGMVAG